jgi:hypothetical protein
MAARIVVGLAGGLLVVAILAEIFVTFLLPRRVKRDPKLVRLVRIAAWKPWRWIARRLPQATGDTMLGIYGPLGFLLDLVMWVGLLMLGYACLAWALGSHLGVAGHDKVSFGSDLYFAAGTLVSSTPAGLVARTGGLRFIQVVDAGTGLGVLAIVIGYLPALFQAYSSREATVSQLDARGGSPPSAGRILYRTGIHGGWPDVNAYLGSWETWSAELMETHLTYPVLSFFRSQHLHQSWLSAMCAILDSCAITIAAAPHGTVDESRFTFMITRHAVVDLAYTLRARPTEPDPDRLPADDFKRLLDQLREASLEPAEEEEATLAERTAMLRSLYEPYVNALAMRVALPLPQWLAPEELTDNWRRTEFSGERRGKRA